MLDVPGSIVGLNGYGGPFRFLCSLACLKSKRRAERLGRRFGRRLPWMSAQSPAAGNGVARSYALVAAESV
jgi:hypothetical protein